MSTVQTWQTTSTSLEATLSLAEAIGRRLRGGEAIALSSDLGGGKTAFVTGLARGAGSSDQVTSPSFTISNEYHAGELSIYHFDFYRLTEPGVMANELAEHLNDDRAVVVIEWADIVDDILPPEAILVELKVTELNERLITVNYPEDRQYLMEDAG